MVNPCIGIFRFVKSSIVVLTMNGLRRNDDAMKN